MQKLFAFTLLALGCAGPVLAQENAPIAPGGKVDILGVSGAYDCTVGDARQIAFRVTEFVDGQYHFEERAGSAAPVGVNRYPWQLATATLYRERVGGDGASKFRRLNGSLRTLDELPAGQTIVADYAEAPLDGSNQPLEWRYRITVGERAASFAPSGLGEVEIVQIEERRTRYVDGQGAPLALADAAGGFDREETARIAYAPSLGLVLRLDRRSDGATIEACSLSAYQRP